MEFPTLNNLTFPFPSIGLLDGISSFIKVLIEHSVSKQWKPWLETPSSVMSVLGLHCLPMSYKKVIVRFDSLRPINNLSVIKGQDFLG